MIKNKSLIKWILYKTKFLSDSCKLSERIFCILYNIQEVIKCEYCGKPVKFKSPKSGYLHFCCRKCASLGSRKKFKNTCIERFGIDNISKMQQVKEKVKNTCIERFGTDSPIKNTIIYNKMKSTLIKKYGVDNIAKTEQSKQKYKSTCIKRYRKRKLLSNRYMQRKN